MTLTEHERQALARIARDDPRLARLLTTPRRPTRRERRRRCLIALALAVGLVLVMIAVLALSIALNS